MEFSPELRAFFKILELSQRKIKLGLQIDKLESQRTALQVLSAHLMDQHWGSGHNRHHEVQGEIRKIDAELTPLREEYDEVSEEIKTFLIEASEGSAAVL